MPSTFQHTPLTNPVAVSPAFPLHPHTDDPAPDLCLLSTDSVHFYVHRTVLTASDNAFDGMLDGNLPGLAKDTPPVIAVSETSAVLNLVLHIVYRKPIQFHVPSVYDVLGAVNALEQYGFPVHPHLAPAGQLCTLLQYYAPLRPLDVYITAARYDVYTLASAASAYLHNHSIPDMSDSLALKMGALYLKRLAELLETRMSLLRTLVLTLPPFHETNFQCSYAARSKLVSGWTYAVTELACDASPGAWSGRLPESISLTRLLYPCSCCT